MQLSVAQQAIECFKRGGDTFSAWPRPRHIGQGQAASGNERLHRTQQHRLAQRMHTAKWFGQTLLQYSAGALGRQSFMVSSPRRLRHARAHFQPEPRKSL